jgi:hypothetical protein
MPEPGICLLFVRPLNQLGVRDMISGSVGAMLYGEPRLTHEVDRQITPDTGPLDPALNSEAVSALFHRIGPAILATHSHAPACGAGFACRQLTIQFWNCRGG